MGQNGGKAGDGVPFPVTYQTAGHYGYRPSTMDFFPGGETKEVDPIEVSPLANTYLPVQLSEATSSRAPGIAAPKVTRTRDWTTDSILEVHSASKGRWYVAYVLQVHPGEYESQMLTVRFWDEHSEAKQKSSPRSDPNLAHIGTHTIGQLPPGFKTQASQSRPGAFAYLDTATGMKYSSPEIAWNVHFQRLRDGPPMQAPAPTAEAELPVARWSPAAIAAGLAEDKNPVPKQPRVASRPTPSPTAAISAAPPSADERWKKAKAEFAADVASQANAAKAAELLAPDVGSKASPARATEPPAPPVSSAPSSNADERWRKAQMDFVADLVKQEEKRKAQPSLVDGQAKRSANQPTRACPTFAPSPLDLPPPPVNPAVSSAKVKKSAPAFSAAMVGSP